MNKKVSAKLGKLEDDALWREASDLAEFMYGKLDEFPEEEKWNTVSKLRSNANELLNLVGLAAGNANPFGEEYDWQTARKYASGLKTMYRFAGRQKFIELDPAIMVRLDKLIDQVDSQIKTAKKQGEIERKKGDAEREKDVDAWREKHKLWKEINK